MFRSLMATEIEALPSAIAQMLGILQNGVEPSGRLPPYNSLSSGFFIPNPNSWSHRGKRHSARGPVRAQTACLANGSTTGLCASSRWLRAGVFDGRASRPQPSFRGHIDAQGGLDPLSPVVDVG